jgi:plasmid stabilization system protein ParE
MLPPELLANLPGNLSQQAVSDLIHILRRSAREWGIATARGTRDRLLARIRAIEAGTAIGHQRRDVTPRAPTLFLVEEPWVIAYSPETWQVYRILHGARDFPAIFPPTASGREPSAG